MGGPSGRPVLVVEDDPDVRGAVASVLERRLGLDVVGAGDGETGLALARARRPALVVVDHHLPGGLTGADVARRLRADPATAAVPVLSVSASPPEPGAPYDAVLAKPFGADRLIEAVRRLLARAGSPCLGDADRRLAGRAVAARPTAIAAGRRPRPRAGEGADADVRPGRAGSARFPRGGAGR